MSHTIILRLQGGLGNQLFQLLALRYLAATHPDLNGALFTQHLGLFKTPRALAIEPFLEQELITHKMNTLDQILFQTKVSRLLAKCGLHAVERVQQLGNWKGQYLNGYFQDMYRYTDKAIVKREVGKMNKVVWQEIHRQQIQQDIETCAVHLRLTDFVETAGQREYLTGYRIPYLKRAIQWYRNERMIKHFFLFSDAPNEARELLDEPDIVLIQEVLKQPSTLFNEFCLFCSFNNIVTSNSTFSFWGSLLGSNKHIVFPAEWNALHITDNKVFDENIKMFNEFTDQKHIIIRL
jgi:hypothetical protein